ncbi:hypothetical protein B0H67DRAFT_3482 [Lasiosphaeris hirsuta]|uniref:Peptidase A1 domain-containing protein n=1 Tax=Lasiosphaeris hirsuta TaxID=260670 RepID=A0AA40B8I3_9PEZI|nr:hypothetical protein B0H67DRAFT_3482 [Lasiosphaeris hirsuta]
MKVLLLSLALDIGQVLSAPFCQAPATIQLSLGQCLVLSPDQTTDVQSWGVRIGVENASEICIVPSTVVNTTFLTSSEICGDDQLDMQGVTMTKEQCRSRRGGFITKAAVPSFSTDGLDVLNPGWVGFDNKITAAANATLQLLTQEIALVEGLITEGQMSTTSHLGLAASSSLLDRLQLLGRIGAKSWGLNSGSQSYSSPRDGSLVLGGYDSSSLAGPFFDYDITTTKPVENRFCPLQILVTGLTMNVQTANSTISRTLVDRSNKLDACIEPYDNLFRVPQAVLDTFQTVFKQATKFSGDSVQPSEYQSSLLNLEPGIVFPKDAGDFNATLRFTINYNQTVDIPVFELIRPLRGLDSKGKVVVNEKYNEIQIYASPAPEDAPVLGKAFLSQIYLYVNYENMKFHLASQNLEANTPLPVASESNSTCGVTQPETGRTAEANGLIAVGTVLGVLILVLVALAVCWKPLQRIEAKRAASKEAGALAKEARPPAPEQPRPATERGSHLDTRTNTGTPPPPPRLSGSAVSLTSEAREAGPDTQVLSADIRDGDEAFGSFGDPFDISMGGRNHNQGSSYA